MSQSMNETSYVPTTRPCDKGRSHNSKTSKKCLHTLLDPTNHIFLGWKNKLQPWTLETCIKYIDWCHIDKVFAYSEYRKHCWYQVANLYHCRDFNFLERCIQVYQHVYVTAFVTRNKCNLAILHMVYVEDKFNCKVDWCMIPTFKNSLMRAPESIDILQKWKFEG